MSPIISRFHSLVTGYDVRVTAFIDRIPKSLKPLMAAASTVGLPVSVVSFALLMAIAGWFSGQFEIVYAQLAILTAMAGNTAIKYAVRRQRPDTLYVASMKIKSYSFPSGHTFGSTVVYGFLAYLILGYFPPVLNIVSAVLLVLLIILVGLSRIFLGAHFPSDVTLGWVLGVGSLILIVSLILW